MFSSFTKVKPRSSVSPRVSAFLSLADQVDPRIRRQYLSGEWSLRAAIGLSELRYEDDKAKYKQVRSIVRAYRLLARGGQLQREC